MQAVYPASLHEVHLGLQAKHVVPERYYVAEQAVHVVALFIHLVHPEHGSHVLVVVYPYFLI